MHVWTLPRRVMVAVDCGGASARAAALAGVIVAHCGAATLRLLHAETPPPRSSAWSSNYGEPLVRYCTVPILFVPEITQGASL